MRATTRMIWFTGFCLFILAATVWAEDKAGNPSRGKAVYERYCISCHGERGDGNGEYAPYTTPRPRDFRQGTFKWRSTPSGSLPLVSDLERTIRDGVYWSAMPSWYPLNKQTRMSVIAYIQTFSPRWERDQPGAPITIPPEPTRTSQSVTRGRSVYEEQSCAKCHGEQGLGDGPSAKTQVDEWGDPSIPFDLTKGRMKGGRTGEDLYRVFMTGLNGTPMPSYVDTIKPDEAWDLVHYIQSLTTANRSLITGARR
jgi:mono/diheme cytochrome c family protein